MSNTEKQIVLIDLSQRLLHGVICHCENDFGSQADLKLYGIDNSGLVDKLIFMREDGETFCHLPIDWVKPYLRPMSSMTDEEKKEYELLANHCIVTSIGFIHLEAVPLIDWLNKNHFDYRGLIERNLAKAVTKENNPYLL